MEISYKACEEIIDRMIDMGYNGDSDCLRDEYSGRGMNGKTCVGFVLSDAECAMILGAAIADVLGVDGIEMIQRARQDTMGLGIIIYFPGVEINQS